MRILAFICFFCCFNVFAHAQEHWFKTQPEWWEERHEAIGVVHEVAQSPTGLACTFQVEDKVYETDYAFFDSKHACEGMMFNVAYNPENPEENFTMVYKPVLEEAEEEVGFAKARVCKKCVDIAYMEDLGKEIATIYFNFRTEEGEYIKNMVFYTEKPEGWSQKDFHKKELLVRYWKKSPERAIIFFDFTYTQYKRMLTRQKQIREINRSTPNFPVKHR